MYTEELGKRIAIAQARAKELEPENITYNLLTGKVRKKRSLPTNAPKRYYVGTKEYAYVREIQEDLGIRTHHDVHFRLRTDHPNWKEWGYIRDRDETPPL